MALQIWLPLNGNIHNQGLLNLNSLTPSQNTMTFNNVGKIGKCGTGMLAWHLTEDILDNAWSVATWVKTSSSFGSANNIIFCKNGTQSTDCQIYFSIVNGSSLHVGVNGPSDSLGKAYTFATNTWYHVAATYDGIKASLYINGIFQKSTNVTTAKPSGRLNIRINGRSTNTGNTSVTGQLAGYSFNDFRLYDHTLSDKEVEDISRGLVLHYKLDNYWLCENILTNSTCYEGLSNWNGNIDIGNENGHPYLITKRTNETSTSRTFCGHTVLTSVISSWPIGDKFTISGYYKVPSSETQQVGCNIFIRWADGGTHDTGFTTSYSVKDTWIRFERTFTIPEYDTSNGQNVGFTFAFSKGLATVYWKDIKLEYGEKATPWSPAKTDNLYSMSKYNSNIIYDCSGYQNNGTIIGSLTAVTSSPRYNVATNLTTTSSHIYTPALITTGFTNSFSISWWGNVSSYSGKMMWGFSDGNRLNGIYNGNLWNTGDGSSNPIYVPGTTTQVGVPSVNTWHHFVMTGDGSVNKIYKDGELWGQSKTYKSLTGTIIYFNGWMNATTYALANTKLSDFRIYATTLSAAAVKELYTTSLKIVSENPVARELSEL